MEIEIRRIGINDVVLLQEIAIKAYSDHYADTWEDVGAWYLQTYFSIEQLTKELRDENTWFYLAFLKGIAVGFLKLNINKPLPGNEENALELERIYLLKSASGKGIGTKLITFVIDLAQQMKTESIWLKVMDTNPAAVRFYQKTGFTICGTHQVDFVQKKKDMRGMFIMQKSL